MILVKYHLTYNQNKYKIHIFQSQYNPILKMIYSKKLKSHKVSSSTKIIKTRGRWFGTKKIELNIGKSLQRRCGIYF